MQGAGHVIGAGDTSRLRAHYASDRAGRASDGSADYLTSQPGAAGVFLTGGDQFSRDSVIVGAGGIVFAGGQQEFVYRFHFVSVFFCSRIRRGDCQIHLTPIVSHIAGFCQHIIITFLRFILPLKTLIISVFFDRDG